MTDYPQDQAMLKYEATIYWLKKGSEITSNEQAHFQANLFSAES